MRKDIAKVLCTRPRILSGYDQPRKGRDIPLDNLPSKEGMRAPHIKNWGGKQLNEYLAPLRRFINGTVGRNWDSVYSEIRERVIPGNNVMEHILQHVDQYIAVNVVPDENSPTGMAFHSSLGNGGFHGYRSFVRPGDLYVDPKTKVIRRAKKFRVQKVKKDVTQFLFSNKIIWKHEGIWYSADLVKFTVISKMVKSQYEPGKMYEQKFYIVMDRYQGRLTDGGIMSEIMKNSDAYRWNPAPRAALFGASDLTAINKRQLSKAELRNYKVSNDAK